VIVTNDVEQLARCLRRGAPRKRQREWNRTAPLLSAQGIFWITGLDKATNEKDALAVSRITQNDQIGLLEPG
jgi:hypothetical protein